MPDIDTTLIYSTKEDTEDYVKSIQKVLDGKSKAVFKGFLFFFFKSWLFQSIFNILFGVSHFENLADGDPIWHLLNLICAENL